VFVAAPPVADALALAVRLAPAIHHARVGSKLAGRGKPMDITRLKRDGQSQHIADAAHGLQCVKLLTQLAFGKDRPLEEPDLLFETTHHRHIGSQSTLLVLKQRQSVNLPILQALDIVALDRLRQVARCAGAPAGLACASGRARPAAPAGRCTPAARSPAAEAAPDASHR